MSSDFVQVGSIRIKRSNIKAYGVATKKVDSGGLVGAIAQWVKGKSFSTGLKAGFLGGHARYLYITTYQNTNHQFDEDQIDIDATLAFLDKQST
jgi:hypothetical protein